MFYAYTVDLCIIYQMALAEVLHCGLVSMVLFKKH